MGGKDQYCIVFQFFSSHKVSRGRETHTKLQNCKTAKLQNCKKKRNSKYIVIYALVVLYVNVTCYHSFFRFNVMLYVISDD